MRAPISRSGNFGMVMEEPVHDATAHLGVARGVAQVGLVLEVVHERVRQIADAHADRRHLHPCEPVAPVGPDPVVERDSREHFATRDDGRGRFHVTARQELLERSSRVRIPALEALDLLRAVTDDVHGREAHPERRVGGELVQLALQLRRVPLVIVVEQSHELAAGSGDPVVSSPRLAAVLPPDRTKRIGLAEALEQAGRPVRRSVVHHDDLVRPDGLGEDGGDRRGQEPLGVVGGNYDADA
jgi:hypothetical protein